MPRKRELPPTVSSVRGLAARRAYLLTREQPEPYGFRMSSLSGQRVAAVSTDDLDHRYSGRILAADAWLRKQPLLRDL
jgi:hypothetical protein